MVIRTLIIVLIVNFKVLASSCCSGANSGNSIIFGDTRFRVTTSYVNKAFISDVNKSGDIKERNNLNVVDETLSMKYRFQTRNYFQYGVEFNSKVVTSKTFSNELESKGVSDAFLSSSYEFMPEIVYSKYKPRGFFTLNLGIPIGDSKYDYSSSANEQALSQGLYSFNPGLVFYKKLRKVDFSASLNSTFFLSRNFPSQSGGFKVRKYPNYNLSFNSFYSFTKVPIILSAGLSHFRVGKERIIQQNESQTPSGYYTNSNLAISYLFDTYSVALNYSDDTLIELARNTTLSKSYTVSFTFFENASKKCYFADSCEFYFRFFHSEIF